MSEEQMDFFLSSLWWASIILLAFFGVLWIGEWIIEWWHFRDKDDYD